MSVWIVEINRKGLLMIDDAVDRDLAARGIHQRQFRQPPQKFRESTAGDAKRHAAKCHRVRRRCGLSLKKRKLRISTVARNHERSAFDGPWLALRHDLEAERVLVPSRSLVPVGHEQLNVIDLKNFEHDEFWRAAGPLT